jgi:hypothetical protein
MTDRLNGCWVAFERDIREDDAEPLIAAIRMLKGVLAVEVSVSSHADWVAEERARRELGEKLWKVIYPDRGKT